MKGEKNYTVFFELFGKKMKTKVLASSSSSAIDKIKEHIIFHKIELSKDDYFNKASGLLDDIFTSLENKGQ